MNFADRIDQRLQYAMAARSPRAQARIKDLPAPQLGIPVYVSISVPEGEFLYSHNGASGKVVFVGPLTFWRLQHPGREPLLSRHCRGLRELERDRRRHAR